MSFKAKQTRSTLSGVTAGQVRKGVQGPQDTASDFSFWTLIQDLVTKGSGLGSSLYGLTGFVNINSCSLCIFFPILHVILFIYTPNNP